VSSEDTVTRIETATNEIAARFPLGGTFSQGTAGPDGMVWIPNKERNTITRFNPRTNRVAGVIAAGPGVLGTTSGFKSVWATSYLGADVRRYRVR
jgi:streptogramin lyase